MDIYQQTANDSPACDLSVQLVIMHALSRRSHVLFRSQIIDFHVQSKPVSIEGTDEVQGIALGTVRGTKPVL